MIRAVVTGASSGIGAAIARRLLADGAQVVGLDRAPASVVAPAYEHLTVDLDDATATADAVRTLDGVTVLVHAAGFMHTAPLGALDHSSTSAMWRLHVDAVMRLADHFVRGMVDAGTGRIVLIGSRVSQGVAGRSQYAAVKSALVGLARSWALELVAKGVTVNVVSPAATATGMLDDPARATTPPKVPPIGRLIQPDEIAAVVSFLASPAAAAITGQEIRVCGGASL